MLGGGPARKYSKLQRPACLLVGSYTAARDKWQWPPPLVLQCAQRQVIIISVCVVWVCTECAQMVPAVPPPTCS